MKGLQITYLKWKAPAMTCGFVAFPDQPGKSCKYQQLLRFSYYSKFEVVIYLSFQNNNRIMLKKDANNVSELEINYLLS